MIDKLFGKDEIPNYGIYEVAHEVVYDYMKQNDIPKIDEVAAKLGTTSGVLYRRLNPDDTTMPLSMDSVIAITHLTGDMRILEAMAKPFDQMLICKKKATAKTSDLNLLVDIANMENSDVFRVVKKAIADDQITPEEREAILKEIDEAQKANAELKDTVLHLAIKDQ